VLRAYLPLTETVCWLGKGIIWETGFPLIGRERLTQISHENITQALNELKHEVLSHQVFLGCFSSAVRRGEIKGLTKSSLFRMTLAYFLLVPEAKEKFLSELEKQLKRKMT
jgi:uncharacterized protein (DUF2062 family)